MITVVVNVLPGTGFFIQNTALGHTDGDLNPDNDTDSDTLDLAPVAPAPTLSGAGFAAALLLLLGVALIGIRKRRSF